MPANFLGSLKRRPVRLKRDETCTWERHLKWGAAERSLWRQLNKFASVQQDGTCWASLRTICEQSAKFEKTKKVGKQNYYRLSHLLSDFQRAGLISPRMNEIDPDGDDTFQVHGQHMHDQLCERVGDTCIYRGWDYAAKRAVKCALVATSVASEVATSVATRVANEVANPVANETDKGSKNGSDSKTSQDLQNPYLQRLTESSNVSIGAPNQDNHLVSHSEELSESGECSQDQVQRQNLHSHGKGFSPMTDQNQTPRPCVTDRPQNCSEKTCAVPARRMPTIRDHFGYTVTLDRISENEIDEGEIDKYGLRVDWSGLRDCCQEEADEKAHLPYLGRKTNGDIMARAMVRWTAKHRSQKVDKFWYAVVKKLREGGPSIFAPKSAVEEESYSPPPPEEQDIFDKAMAAGVITFENFKHYFFGPSALFNFADWSGPNKCKDHRAGWKLLNTYTDALPEPLQKVRDWTWENDAMPDKPAAPPWK